MSKYYYVKSKAETVSYSSVDGFESVSYDHLWLNKYGMFSPFIESYAFSREELTKLFDGDLYREYPCLPLTWVYRTDGLDKMLGLKYDKDLDIYVWINPLIELVEKED